ncbi:DUF262 domain-containing protein [Streptomyces xiamenensis]|uniref:DUF262 domain-containing protein n=1 Tax=Streptomyces xiamenensis TaxID=408015 RepID=UPI0035E334D4
MTHQTDAPIVHSNLSPHDREARELIRDVARGEIDIDPAYQRGSVWDVSQQIALIRSWLLGLPTGVIILSNRANPRWTAANGDVYETSAPVAAVVDGKQRLTAAQAWFNDELLVPASWFKPETITHTEGTDDGLYLRYSGLTRAGQLTFARRARLLVCEFTTAANIADEAAIFLLVNGGGTPQTDQDVKRANTVAIQQV